MVSFAFDEEHEQFRKTLEDFTRKELTPKYRDRAASSEFPFEVLRQLGELGVLGIGLPEEFGGTGAEDPVLLGLATETLARGDVNLASAPVQIGLIASQLVHGTREVQERYLPAMIEGRETVAIALTEPGSGSDAGALATTAKPVDGGWSLTGEKTAITWACNASAALVYARDPGSSRSRGVSCYLVPLDAPGITVSPMPGMGCLPLGWGSIHLDDVFVPAEHLIGEQGRGFHTVMDHFDFSRAALGLMCLGAARASLDEAAVYATQRESFGRPIGEYQGVSFPLAEHATYLEAARWLCYRALWLRSEGKPHTSLASMSKWWPPVVAKDAIEASIKIHGNLGYSAEFPLQQRFRDVMAYLVADGTSEIQKRIISREILSRGSAAF
ncbi:MULTISPECIES: acyl-CoA dehydrogenase family protein [unclassified Pseudonocardia]|uniref:acyl-CoA dehydrogenase family protein n=1 Tax=unclassified Pseudonocardia TaxID=2619320 RepID=UPI0001FFE7A1|nr:acyl-CoA dehydrogenase family protein [Pseudonocardia sp. Ae707_Ps1]OLM09260.1 Butyryl-CoA dehydrogenase [Pseudonocardia sp. Ae707_Ps1]